MAGSGRGVKVSDLPSGNILPGRHNMVPSIWRGGELLRAQRSRSLGYFVSGEQSERVFSLSTLAKTILATEAVKISAEV